MALRNRVRDCTIKLSSLEAVAPDSTTSYNPGQPSDFANFLYASTNSPNLAT